MFGWLNLRGVYAAGPRVIDEKRINLDCGAGIISENRLFPLFLDSPVYNQTAIGNIELTRNLSFLNHLSFFTTSQNLQKIKKAILKDFKRVPNQYAYSVMQLVLSKEGRLVMDPKAMLAKQKNIKIETFIYYEKVGSKLAHIYPEGLDDDPYINVSLYQTKPSMLDL